jgi:[FeFe] hydrogenase H-cluster maturation GTPase HydF
MSLTSTPSAERIHIGFFGMRNAGKSSLINAVTGQPVSLASPIAGTTTDPVKKAMELLPLGPVLIIDTPGLDDDQDTLGAMRVKRAREILATVHIAVLVVDASRGMSEQDEALRQELQARGIPWILAYNKADLLRERPPLTEQALYVSAESGEGITALKDKLGSFAGAGKQQRVPVSDLVAQGDAVVLVTPIDESAPKGRLILPQQLVLRDLLDAHAIPLLCQPQQLPTLLSKLNTPPRMVITDSQVFGKVSPLVPTEVPLTSFSILMARYKGDLATLIRGAAVLSHLRDGDRVLICEGCTHHRQCNDIGTVKLPGWIADFAKATPIFDFTSGGAFPEDLSSYRLIVHCGGCMLQENEMQRRLHAAKDAGVPIVNYGIAIAHMHGILQRSLALFPDVLALLQNTQC